MNYGMKLKKKKKRINNTIMSKLSLAFLLCCIVAIGCDNKKNAKAVVENVSDNEIADTTVYGKCGEGTAMHTLELITDKGDTLIRAQTFKEDCLLVTGWQ